jgi:predicted RND superfamily exporter protein
VEYLKKRSRTVIAVIASLVAVAVYLCTQLRFSYDFEAFFPQNDPATDYYLQFRDDFETDNDFFIVVLENSKGILDSNFLQKADSCCRALRQLEHVTECHGITTLREPVQDPFLGQIFEVPLIQINDPSSYSTDSIKISEDPDLMGYFVSSDWRSLALNLKHTKNLSKLKGDDLSIAIEKTVAPFGFDTTHCIGRVLGQRLYVELMIKELLLFISMSLLLTILFLYIAFRSFWGIIIPTLIVLLSILFTIGLVRLTGNELDLMMTILPTILFVVGMSDSVHVLTKYLQELRKGTAKNEAIIKAFKSIRLATFLTALTTSIGFLTLVFSNIQPVSNFGVYTSAGIMLAFGLTYTLLPAILFLIKPGRLQAFAVSEDFWGQKLQRSFTWIIRNRKYILGGTAMVLIASGIGISTIEVDNKMLEDLRDTHLLKQEFFFMEDHYAGCRPFELGVVLSQTQDAPTLAQLRKIDSLENYLRNQYGVGGMMSYNAVVKRIHKATHGGETSEMRLPDDDVEYAKIKKLLARKEFKDILSLSWSPEQKTMRIAGKIGDLGRKHYEQKNEELMRYCNQLAGNDMTFNITGTAHLIDLNNRYLVENMVWDLLLSVLVIGIIMGFVYRSWAMVPLTILPNLVPLLIVAGIMGYSGIPIKVSTSIIFNIAFGIAVDDTIHFLARVRTLCREGLSVPYAVKRTFLTTGKAMIVTTLILSGGFLTLVLSDFMGTWYIGLLISLTLFVAIFAELMLTPIIVTWGYRPKQHKLATQNINSDKS